MTPLVRIFGLLLLLASLAPGSAALVMDPARVRLEAARELDPAQRSALVAALAPRGVVGPTDARGLVMTVAPEGRDLHGLAAAASRVLGTAVEALPVFVPADTGERVAPAPAAEPWRDEAPDGYLPNRTILVAAPTPEAAAALAAAWSPLAVEESLAPAWQAVTFADAMTGLAAAQGLEAQGVAVDYQWRTWVVRRFAPPPDDPLYPDQWPLANTGQTGQSGIDIRVELAWEAGLSGAGLNIAFLDDGLETTHADLGNSLALGGSKNNSNHWDWVGGDNNPAPFGPDAHGVAIAGLTAATGDNAAGVTGVAPAAGLIGLRLVGAALSDANVAEALNWKTDLVSISLAGFGPDDDGQTLEYLGLSTRSALAGATNSGRNGRGVIFVWPAGNGGSTLTGDRSDYDAFAASPFTIAVAAVDAAGEHAPYSEAGANVLIAAPGGDGTIGMPSTDRTGADGYNPSGDYVSNFGGTSAAAAHVAGLAALMIERYPALTWRDVQEILLRSARLTGDGGHPQPDTVGTDWFTNAAGYTFSPRFGAGLIDATAAITLTDNWSLLPARQSETVTLLPLESIGGSPQARTYTFSTTKDLRVEQITLTADVSHTARGDLRFRLTSPAGTVSTIGPRLTDTGDNLAGYPFLSVHFWGEASLGDWTLEVRDMLPATDNGTINRLDLVVLGAVFPPAPPTDLAVVTLQANHVALTWTDAATDEDGYEVERWEATSGWQVLTTLAADSSSYTDTTVVSEGTYRYRVRAFRND